MTNKQEPSVGPFWAGVAETVALARRAIAVAVRNGRGDLAVQAVHSALRALWCHIVVTFGERWNRFVSRVVDALVSKVKGAKCR